MNDYAAADVDARQTLWGAVVSVGGVGAALSLPAPGATLVGIISTTVAAKNVKPPSTYARVAFACEQIADRLEEIENGGGDFKGLQPIAKKIKGEWEGPGADAFDSYVNDELVPGLQALRKACREVAPVYQGTSEDMLWAIQSYFVLNGVNIVYQIVLNIILVKSWGAAAPGVMPAKAASVIFTVAGIIGIIGDVINILMANATTSDELTEAMKDLVGKMEKKSNWINQDALAMSKSELKDIEDPNEWTKE